MSQNRILATLNKVEPTKTILIKTFRCEHQAAYIRNQAVESINRGDIKGVAYRYLQSRQGEDYTFFEAIFWGTLTGIILAASLYIYNNANNAPFSENNDSNTNNMILNLFPGFLLIANLAPFINCVINTNNTRRYKETKEGCEAWLKEKIDINTFRQIKQSDLPFRKILTIFQNGATKSDDKIEDHKSKLKLT